MRRLLSCLAALSLLSAADAAAQQPAAAPTALTVFLDCQDVFCDFDFFRTDITSVNWVRDRADADVHVLVTGQDTGAGGRQFHATFIGLKSFAGLMDTLHTSLPPGFSDDARRQALAQLFRAGLVRYVARVAGVDKLTISLGTGAAASTQTSTKADPWHAWVFSLESYINGYGEQNYDQYNLSGGFSANRVTEKWKTQLSTYENYSDSKNTYAVEDTLGNSKDTTVTNPRRSYNVRVLQVRALNQHWSIGLRAELNSSTYENTERQIRVTPAVEYNVFPFKESSRHQFRIEYGIGATANSYRDTTIYDKMSETLPLHRLASQVMVRQPWGSIDFGSTYTGYFTETNKYRISSYAGMNLNLFKGFSFSVYPNYDVIHDQFSLAKKSYSAQQILLRQFQRGSTYSFGLFGSIRYSFGSIFNNVVNPRFD